MKTVYAHIGRAKTGTSTLQSFLASNRAELRRRGIKYADTAFFHNTHHPLAWSLHKEAYESGKGQYWTRASGYATLALSSEQYWSALRREICHSPEDSFVISSEEFGVVLDLHATAPLLAKHISPSNLKFIVYLRRQDDFLQSVYNQAIKGEEARFTKDFWSYVNPILEVGGADCMKVLEPLAATVGDENVIVRVYEKEQLKENLFVDFLDALGIQEYDAFSYPQTLENVKLDERAIPIIRNMNKISMSGEIRRRLIDRLQSRFEGNVPFDGHDALSPADRLALLQRFTETNAEAARRFLGRGDGRLFYAPLPDAGLPWQPRPNSGEEVLEIMTDLWRHYVKLVEGRS